MYMYMYIIIIHKLGFGTAMCALFVEVSYFRISQIYNVGCPLFMYIHCTYMYMYMYICSFIILLYIWDILK